MAVYTQIIFSGTLVHSNIIRLRLIRAFFDAWFAQNKFLTEGNLLISVVHFSFATIFQYFKFVRFCSYSKLKFSYRCSLQWWKPFVDIFFHLREISKQTLGNIKKNRSNFEQRERKYANTWGGGGRARGQNSLQKHSYCSFFCIHNTLFPLRFHFYALLKLQLNCEITILPFSGT